MDSNTEKSITEPMFVLRMIQENHLEKRNRDEVSYSTTRGSPAICPCFLCMRPVAFPTSIIAYSLAMLRGGSRAGSLGGAQELTGGGGRG